MWRFRGKEGGRQGWGKFQYPTNDNLITGVQYTKHTNTVVVGSDGHTIFCIKCFKCNNQKYYTNFCLDLVFGRHHATTVVELNNDNGKHHAT